MVVLYAHRMDMIMNKTIRNKALKDANRLITATLNGEDWACPDGHFAIAYPIYEGYKIKKSQDVPYNKPELARILPTGTYTAIDDVVDYDDVDKIELVKNYDKWSVNKVYYDLIKSIYPAATARVDASGYHLAPIMFYVDDTFVAVLMPLRK